MSRSDNNFSAADLRDAVAWRWPLAGEQARFEALRVGYGGRSLAQAIQARPGYSPIRSYGNLRKSRQARSNGSSVGRPADTYRGVRRAHLTVGRGAAKRALRRTTREQLEADLAQKKA
jgi:hypothetical protein